jgi:hypothetical protein
MQTGVTALQSQLNAAYPGTSASPGSVAPSGGGFVQDTTAQSIGGVAPAGQDTTTSGAFAQDPSAAGGLTQDPNAAAKGFAQDASGAAPSQFIQNCCASQIQGLQTAFSGVAQLVPSFSSQYRNLNLFFVGLNMLNDMLGRAQQMRDSMVALKTAPDAQTALAALNSLLTNVQGASQAITTQFQNLGAAAAFGVPGGAIGNQAAGVPAVADAAPTATADSQPASSSAAGNQTTSGGQTAAGAAAGKALDAVKKKLPFSF